MANWNEPTNNTNTLSVLDAINAKIESSAKMDFTGDTNIPTGVLRYNNTNKQFESWSGTAWTSLSVLMPDGTAAAPSFSFSDDPNTGVYRVGTDRIGIATAGAFRFGIDEGGFVYFGNAILSATPSQGTISGTLGLGTNIAGADIRIQGGNSTGNAAGGAVIFRTSGTGTSGSSSNAQVERMRVTSAGDVGIGSNAPTAKLEVVANTASDGINLTRGGSNRVQLTGDGIIKWGSTANAGTLTWDTGRAVIHSQTGLDLSFGSGGTADRMRVKTTGQVRFVPLTADPGGAEDGDVYYNSTSNKLRVRAGGAWVDLH